MKLKARLASESQVCRFSVLATFGLLPVRVTSSWGAWPPRKDDALLTSGRPSVSSPRCRLPFGSDLAWCSLRAGSKINNAVKPYLGNMTVCRHFGSRHWADQSSTAAPAAVQIHKTLSPPDAALRSQGSAERVGDCRRHLSGTNTKPINSVSATH